MTFTHCPTPSSYDTCKLRLFHSEDLTPDYVRPYTVQARANDPEALASIVRRIVPSFELHGKRYAMVVERLESELRREKAARAAATLFNIVCLNVALAKRDQSALFCFLGLFNIAFLPICWSWRTYLHLSPTHLSFRYTQSLLSVTPLAAHYREKCSLDRTGLEEICERVEEMAGIHEEIGWWGWGRVEGLLRDEDGVSYVKG